MDRKEVYGKGDLKPVPELEVMACETRGFTPGVSRSPETSCVSLIQITPAVVCMRVGCHYSRQLDSPKRLYVREAIVHAPFDTSSNVITYIIGHECATARRGASYGLSRCAESSNVSTIETGA